MTILARTADDDSAAFDAALTEEAVALMDGTFAQEATAEHHDRLLRVLDQLPLPEAPEVMLQVLGHVVSCGGKAAYMRRVTPDLLQRWHYHVRAEVRKSTN